MTACAVYVPPDGPPVYGYDSAVSLGHSVYVGDGKRIDIGDMVILTCGAAAVGSWLRYGRRPTRRGAESPEEYLYRLAAAARAEFPAPTVTWGWLAIATGAAWCVAQDGCVRRISPGRCEGIGSGAEIEAAWRALEIAVPGMPAAERMHTVLHAIAWLYPAIVCEPIYVVTQ